MDVIARSPDCAGQAADAVSAYTQSQNGGRSKVAENSKVRVSRYMDTSSTTPVAPNLVKHRRPVVPLERYLYGHPLAGLLWERQSDEVLLGTWMEKSTKLRMSLCSSETRIVLVGVRG